MFRLFRRTAAGGLLAIGAAAILVARHLSPSDVGPPGCERHLCVGPDRRDRALHIEAGVVHGRGAATSPSFDSSWMAATRTLTAAMAHLVVGREWPGSRCAYIPESRRAAREQEDVGPRNPTLAAGLGGLGRSLP